MGTLLLVELLVVAPFALAATGGGLREGVRNPSGSSKASSETQIIADTGGYSTRQSNVSSTGGGAIYGCRSGVGGTATGNEPCLRANNLRDGLAFEFQATRGNVGGLIQFGPNLGKPVDATPFVTNGTGTVKNLSADRLDGIDSAQLATKTDIAKVTDRVNDIDGRVSPGYTSAQAGGQSDILLFNDKDPGAVPLGLRLVCESLPDGQLRARILGIGERFSISGSAGVLIPAGGVVGPVANGREDTIALVNVDSKTGSANFYTYSYAAQIMSILPSFQPQQHHLMGTLVVDIRPTVDTCIAGATTGAFPPA